MNFCPANKYFLIIIMCLTLVGHRSIAQTTPLELSQISEFAELSEEYVNKQPDSAIYFASRVIENGARVPDSILIRAHKSLAKANYVLSNTIKSYEHSTKVIELADRLNDEQAKLFGQVHLGLTYLLQDKIRKSIEVFEEYLELALEMNDSISVSRAYLDLSICYDDSKSYDTALYYANKGIANSRSIGETYYLAMIYNRKGYIFSGKESADSAIFYHQKAVETMASDNQWEKAFAYAGLAKAYALKEDFEESVAYGEKGLSLAKSINSKWEIKNVSEILTNAYTKKGDYKKALEYHVLFKAYHDSIYTEENEQKINALQLKEAQFEKEALIQENQLKDQILKQRESLILLLVLFALVLTAFVIGLFVSIKKRKKYQNRIAKQRDELDELNHSKDRIISILAHDMRSPIGSILNLLGLVKSNPEMEKQAMEILVSEVYESTATVSNTLDQLLDWSISQFQRRKTNPQVVNPVLQVEEQLTFWKKTLNEKEIGIIHHKEHAADLWAEVQHVSIILRNFLSNAIKFSEQGGKIEIGYLQNKGMVGLYVKDHGVGMEEETLQNLFQSKKMTKPGTNKEKGTGIGLFLCNEYAEMNGGTIKALSKLNEGSMFELWLPKAE